MPRTRVIKIAPLEYMHVLNLNSNVTTLIIGPRTFTCMDNQNVVLEPQPMLVVPKGHFCVVENPVIRTEDGSAKVDEYGQPQLFHGEREIRFPQQPFPLYPGEVLKGKVEQTKVIPAGQALVLRAVTNFVDVVEQDTGIRPDPSIATWEPSAVTPGAPSAVDSKRANAKGQKPKGQTQERKKEDAEGEEAPSPSLELVRVARRTGDEWLVKGPGHYYPRIEEEVLELRSERRVAIGEALVMEALADCIDERYLKARSAGEKWLMREPGLYLPGPYEKVLKVQKEHILSENTAIHIRAEHDFKDELFDVERRAGDEWLVTNKETKAYLLGVHEEFLTKQQLLVLDVRSYLVVQNPWDSEEKRHRIGEKETRRGPAQFFLQPPFESVRNQLRSLVLKPHQRILITAQEEFDDYAGSSSKHNNEVAIHRRVGDQWKFYGPGEYWPPHQVSFKEQNALFFSTDFGFALFDYHVATIVAAFAALFLALYLQRALL